jgi:hypothetical protein
LVEEHNKTLKSRMVTIRKRPKRAIAEKPQEKSNSQKAAAVGSKVLPMKKRMRRELDTKVEEQNVGQNGEVIDDIALINDNRPDRSTTQTSRFHETLVQPKPNPVELPGGE